MLDRRGYAYVRSYALIKNMFYTSMLAIVIWSVLSIELKLGICGIRLPWYGAIPLILLCICASVCDALLGKAEYRVACFKETLQIHKLCIFLGEYSELGMEENIKWLIGAGDKYYASLRGILLYLATGREAPWQTVADNCGEPSGTRLLRTMWARILEHIKELDVYRNKERDSVFKNQYEYAEKLCDEHIKVLLRGRVFMCKIIAYLPVFVTILFYMIYPFVLEGIKLLNMYSEEMKSLGLN